MAFPWKPTPFGPRARDLQWINSTMTTHDLYCGCDHPPQHLLLVLLTHSSKLGLQKEHIENTQKCLGFGEEGVDGTRTTTTAVTHEEDYIEDGDLAALFDENTEDTG